MSLHPVTRHRQSVIVLAIVIAMVSSCSENAPPVAPTFSPTRPPPPPPSTPAQPPVFPVLARTGDIYMGPEDLYRFYESYHGGTLLSRYVIFADSQFTLQFASPRFGTFEYVGRYETRSNSEIKLLFQDNSFVWQASATLRGDSLSVAYNAWMRLSDFVDGVYVRSR